MRARFSIRRLLTFVAFFAISLATGIPGDHIVPDGLWRVVSLHEEENGAMWHGEDPDTGEPCGGVGMDYVIAIRDGAWSKSVNLGDINVVWVHQLPTVGGYIVLQEPKTDTHGTLPVTVVNDLPSYTVIFSVLSSLLLSVFLVFFGVAAHRFVNRSRVATTAS